MSGSAPEMTSGRPARGDPRSLAGRGQARGFVDWGGPIPDGASTASGRPIEIGPSGHEVRLNFVNVELQEFARAVFEEVLHENVIVDPAVTGRITVRAGNPISKKAALALVREALQASGATLSRPGNVWRIGPAPRNAGPSREMVRVIPLRFIGITEARGAIQPFLGANGNTSDVAASGTGRFLVLAGRTAEVEGLEQVVATFDVDELRGRAFALVPLKQAGAAPVAQDLLRMIGSEGIAQGVKVFPVERMNAIMVASSNPDVIERVRGWIGGLDQSGQDQRRVYIYPVRNRRAAEIAKVLDGMLQGRGRVEAGTDGPAVAPGLTPQHGSLSGTGSGSRGGLGNASFGAGSSGLSAQFTALPSSEFGREENSLGTSTNSRSQGARDAQSGVEVRADIATNTLVVVSRPEDYHIVASAIRNLDVLPTQVLIEATIAEVRLNEALRHGVRWYFQAGGLGQGASMGSGFGTSGRSVTGQGSAGEIALTYSLGLANAKLAISALESVTDVEIVSSPALTVLDNQTATLKVGEQVPIATRSARSVVNADAPLVNDIEMKDTGVILQVTPRVNAGGLVMLDIKQEASDVVPTTTSNLDSPTIRLRQITSTIAVKSGAEIVLGGIIQRGRHRGAGGVPFLRDIPLLGTALNNIDSGQDRTELVIIIRPTVMANNAEVSTVTGEIKRRLHRGGAKPVLRARY
ncbi:type II secretion system secretin GspD [Methylorubrum extorquens]|uniref:General secretion protein D n=1 Tax=Methylorubrum extorquens (strain ATCC 14718 / DSM 1338 / JCM 2805 / NCIMB 9133 / AM1) TaxID=272630 RepID=C5B3Y6_METEA|nr:type II secretion system secretin GspD [Methylorubrum extorquens]ACS43168.1 putative General secretion protein D [Methylorubrum extorquens AM1]MCP1545759.1 general secretion pathway protein D [Methylorubrum extorquens]MCP1591710.1 general secretion pathway protein D [Methylorubrum extorquens]